jgi:flagellar assembly protein FliH
VGSDKRVLEHTPAVPETAEPDADVGAETEDTEVAAPEALEVLQVPSIGESFMREAQAEADKLLAETREQALAMLAEAEARVEEHRQRAFDDGFKEGHAAGLAQGEAEGLARAQAAIDEANERSHRLISLAEEQGRQALLSAERDMVELALAVASKVLVKEIEENPVVVLPIIRAALDKVRDHEQVTLRVHPADYELALAARLELSAMMAKENALAVVADAALKNGDCVMETPYGTVDARIDTQLELVKTALRELMP